MYTHLTAHKLIDIKEYLPPATLHWCSQKLALAGIDLLTLRAQFPVQETSQRVYQEAYLWLCIQLRTYIKEGHEPILEETPPPEGGYKYYKDKGRAVAEIICGNANTVLERSSKIRTMPVPAEAANITDAGWEIENLEVNS